MQLSFNQITFRYPGADTTVFEDLSFQMAGPGFNALFGPSGVGKTELAKALAECGARVAVADLRLEAAEAVADEINAAGETAMGVECNVLESASLEAARERIRTDLEATLFVEAGAGVAAIGGTVAVGVGAVVGAGAGVEIGRASGRVRV